MSDPLQELAPFLARAREDGLRIEPPDYLTRRIMQVQAQEQRPPIAPIPEEEPLPRSFGPYLLEAIIGRGGSGTVYRGYDAELERHVAVKVLLPSLAQDWTARARFLREARAMARLRDDALMPLLAVHQDTPEPCFTMPLLDGETLQSRLHQKGCLEVSETLRLAAQICQGLTVAHESGLVHRDLKPSNIFLETRERHPRVRLMDFGLAKTKDEPSVTRQGEIAGTPSFMSPEQIDGLPLDGRADLYSLGATLFMLLSGKPPYEGRTITATLQQAALGGVPPLTETASQVPAWLSDLVSDLLEREPAHRPASARVVSERLSRQCATGRSARRRGRVLFVAGLAVTLLASLLLGAFLLDKEERAAPQPAFDLVQELARQESGEILRIPAGRYYLASQDFGSRDISLLGDGRATELIFAASDDPSIRTAGKLTLRNLVLDCSASLPGGGEALIHSDGELVALHSCRVQQARAMDKFPEASALIEVAAGSETRICASEVFSLPAIVWRSRESASLVVEDSAIVAPGLIFAKGEDGLGRAEVRRTTCVTQIFASLLVTGEERKRFRISLSDSAVDCSASFLWFPLGGQELLRESLAYEGRDSLLMLHKSLVNTGLRPRGGGTRMRGELDGWKGSAWRAFWGEHEQGVALTSQLISRSEMFNGSGAFELESSALSLPPEYRELGANLGEVGPGGEGQ